MDLVEAVMLVVQDRRKGAPALSARQAIDDARNVVEHSDVVNMGGDLETAFLLVLDHPGGNALDDAVRAYGSQIPTRTSGRLGVLAQDVILQAKEVNGYWLVDTDRVTFEELAKHGLAVEVDGQRVLTDRGEYARTLIPIL